MVWSLPQGMIHASTHLLTVRLNLVVSFYLYHNSLNLKTFELLQIILLKFFFRETWRLYRFFRSSFMCVKWNWFLLTLIKLSSISMMRWFSVFLISLVLLSQIVNILECFQSRFLYILHSFLDRVSQAKELEEIKINEHFPYCSTQAPCFW